MVMSEIMWQLVEGVLLAAAGSIATYLITRKKTNAEIEKLQAEKGKLQAEKGKATAEKDEVLTESERNKAENERLKEETEGLRLANMNLKEKQVTALTKRNLELEDAVERAEKTARDKMRPELDRIHTQQEELKSQLYRADDNNSTLLKEVFALRAEAAEKDRVNRELMEKQQKDIGDIKKQTDELRLPARDIK